MEPLYGAFKVFCSNVAEFFQKIPQHVQMISDLALSALSHLAAYFEKKDHESPSPDLKRGEVVGKSRVSSSVKERDDKGNEDQKGPLKETKTSPAKITFSTAITPTSSLAQARKMQATQKLREHIKKISFTLKYLRGGEESIFPIYTKVENKTFNEVKEDLLKNLRSLKDNGDVKFLQQSSEIIFKISCLIDVVENEKQTYITEDGFTGEKIEHKYSDQEAIENLLEIYAKQEFEKFFSKSLQVEDRLFQDVLEEYYVLTRGKEASDRERLREIVVVLREYSSMLLGQYSKWGTTQSGHQDSLPRVFNMHNVRAAFSSDVCFDSESDPLKGEDFFLVGVCKMLNPAYQHFVAEIVSWNDDDKENFVFDNLREDFYQIDKEKLPIKKRVQVFVSKEKFEQLRRKKRQEILSEIKKWKTARWEKNNCFLAAPIFLYCVARYLDEQVNALE